MTDSLIFASQELREAGSLAKASTPEPFSTSRTSNWVARAGGLPPYVQHIAHRLMKDPKHPRTESEAIELAVGIIEKPPANWGPEARAAAAKAFAEWEAKKGPSKPGSAVKSAAKSVAEGALREGAGVGCTVPAVSDQGVMSVFEEVDTSQLTMPKSRHRDGQFTNVGRKVTGRGKPFASMMDDLAKQGHVKNVPGKGGVPEVTIGTSPDSGGIGGWMFGSMPDTFATSVALGGLGEDEHESVLREADDHVGHPERIVSGVTSRKGKLGSGHGKGLGGFEGFVHSVRKGANGSGHEHVIGTTTHVTGMGSLHNSGLWKARTPKGKMMTFARHADAIKALHDTHKGHGPLQLRETDWDGIVEAMREPVRPPESILTEEAVFAGACLQERAIHASKREELASKGQAIKGADGKISYPIENAKDLANAATLARSGHGDVPAAKKLIAKMSKKLGVKNPLEEGEWSHLPKDKRPTPELLSRAAKISPHKGHADMVERDRRAFGKALAGEKLDGRMRRAAHAHAIRTRQVPHLREKIGKLEEATQKVQEAVTGRKRKLLEGMSDGRVVPIHGHDVQHFAQLQASGHVTHVGPGFSKARITRKGKAALELKEHAEALAELELLLEGDGPRDYGADAWSGAVARAKSLNQGEVMRFPDGTAIGRHATGDGRDAWSVGTPATWREGNLSYGAPHRTPERAVKAAMETSAGSTDPESLGGEQSYYRGMQVQANGNGLRFAGVSPETGNPLVSHPNSPTFKPQEVDWSVLKPNSDTIYQRA